MPHTSERRWASARTCARGPLGGVLLAQTVTQDAERDVYADHDLALARENGEPIPPEAGDEAVRAAAEGRWTPAVRLHDLRHGRASLLLASRTDIAVISRTHSSENDS